MESFRLEAEREAESRRRKGRETLRMLILAEAGLLTLLGLAQLFLPAHKLQLFVFGLSLPALAVALFVVNRRTLGFWLAVLNLLMISQSREGFQVQDLLLLGLAVALAWTSQRPSAPEEEPVEDAPVLRVPSLIREALLRKVGEAAAQEERNRLARDLHDSIKQELFSMHIGAATAQERWERDPEGARTALADVRRSARQAMVEMEVLLHQLRPQALNSTRGLLEALREQGEALGYRSGARVTVVPGPEIPDERMPPGAREALFRIAQEALANVARHARAGSVRVWIGVEAEHAALRVEDDGQGFDPQAEMSGMGLRNLRERAAALGGTCQIASVPGQGTALAVHLPLLPPPASVRNEDPFARQLRVYTSVLWLPVLLSLLSLLAPFGISAGRYGTLQFNLHLFRRLMDDLTVWTFFALAALSLSTGRAAPDERFEVSPPQPTSLMSWESLSPAITLACVLSTILIKLHLEEPLQGAVAVSAFLASTIVIGSIVRNRPGMLPSQEARLQLAAHRATAALFFAAAMRAAWFWTSPEEGPSSAWLTAGLASLGLAVLELVRFHRLSERRRTAPAWLSQLKARFLGDRLFAVVCVLMSAGVVSGLLISVGYTVSQLLSDPDPVRIAFLLLVPVVFVDLLYLRLPRAQGAVQ